MEKKSADFVVIGCGACGLAAALQAGFGGASVIILDKNKTYGGMSTFSEGMFAVGTKYQSAMKLPYTVEDRFLAHMEASHWKANPLIVRTFMEKTADTIEWLEDIGCEFTGVRSFYSGAPFVWHMIKGSPEGAHSSSSPAQYGLLKPMMKKVEELKNITVMLETKAVRIIRDGGIKGVVAETKCGEQFEIEALCVLCSAGGYGNDREMMDKYIEGGEYMIPCFNMNQTGDALKMAWDVGAEKDGLGVIQAYPLIDKEFVGTAMTQISQQPNLWVNKLGERYCDESIVGSFPLAINALVRQPEAVAYNILDQGIIEFLENVGLQINFGEYFKPGQRMENIGEQLEKSVSEGKVLSADTIDELADKIGCPKNVLNETIDEYNACCDRNEDFVLAKHKKYLRPIRTPKYYAIRINALLGITEGGIKVNHHMEVMDKDFHTIPGLYAGGCTVGGLVGDTYIMITSGGSISFAVNSGRIAAESALKYLEKA